MYYNKKGHKADQFASKSYQKFVSSELQVFLNPQVLERTINEVISGDALNWKGEYNNLISTFMNMQKENLSNIDKDYYGITMVLKETAEIHERFSKEEKQLRYEMKCAVLKKLEIETAWGQIFFEAILLKSGFSVFEPFTISQQACLYIYNNISELTTVVRKDIIKVFQLGNNERYSVMMEIALELSTKLPGEGRPVKKSNLFLLEEETRKLLLDRRDEWEPYMQYLSELSRERIQEFIDGSRVFNNAFDGYTARVKLLKALKDLSWRIKKYS